MWHSDSDVEILSSTSKSTVMGMLAVHQSRWEEAHFHLPRSWFSRDPFPLKSCGRLKELNLALSNSILRPQEHWKMDNILDNESAAPNLTDLIMQRIRPTIFWGAGLLPILPWNTLHYVTIDSPCSDDDLIELLTIGVSLVGVGMSMNPSVNDTVLSRSVPTTARHEKLVAISLIGATPGTFQRLDLPSLTRLSITRLTDGRVGCMNDFLGRTPSLSNVRVHNTNVKSILPLDSPTRTGILIGVRVLEITVYSKVELRSVVDFFHPISSDSSKLVHHLLPNLQTVQLRIRFSSPSFRDDDPLLIQRTQEALVSLVRNRVDSPKHSLKTVKFVVAGEKSDSTKDICTLLKTMILKGLVVDG